MTEPLRPGYFAPDQDTDERALQTIAANIGHDSDTTILLMAEISRRNSEALVLSATGVDLDSDLTVTVGHKHDDRDHALEWMDSQSFSFAAGAGVDSDKDGYLVTSNSAAVVGVCFLLPPLVAASDSCIYTSLRWRLRVRLPAYDYLDCTLFAKIEIVGEQDLTTTKGSAALTAAYPQAESDIWIEGPLLISDSLRTLTDSDGTPWLVVLYAHVDAQAATIFDLQIQWGPQ